VNAGHDTEFAGRYGPWVLVAGASEGVGAAFAMEVLCEAVDSSV
jgi:hypothetical protein